MVINPHDSSYAQKYINLDVIRYNSQVLKKDRIMDMPDVRFATNLVKCVVEKLGLVRARFRENL
jgi:hypothetical protein